MLTNPSPTSDAVLVERFRWVLIALSVSLGLGTLVELAVLRHWTSTTQLIPWVVVVLSILTCLVWAKVRTVATQLMVRGTAVVSLLGALFGVWEHISANLESAPFSSVWAETWPTLTPVQQLWEAVSGGVSLAPPIAPGFAALSGVCAVLSTLWWRAEPAPTSVPTSTSPPTTP